MSKQKKQESGIEYGKEFAISQGKTPPQAV